MRNNLIQYINLLFAGAPDSEDIRDEILQNTLDRYDDLVSQGKSPEAAYSIAISGIGDINEILGKTESIPQNPSTEPQTANDEERNETREARTIKAWAIGMYICSPIPLFILSEFGLSTLGLCLTLLLIAAATVRIVMIRKNQKEEPINNSPESTHQQERKKVSGIIIRSIALILYFLVSFLTHAWYITWLIFPIAACIRGLINAIIDLMEVNDYET